MSSYNRPSDDFESFIDFNGGFDQSNYADEQQTYSGPSHEYDLFRQQTGLPPGSMANVSAYTDMNVDTDITNHSESGRSASVAGMPGYTPSSNFDMDFEQTPQSTTYPNFYPQSNNTDDFINPTAVYEPPPPVRMYPGMHTQQAQQRAAAMAKQQPQQQLPHHQMMQYTSGDQSQSKGKARAGSQSSVADTVADRRISEILDNMRHKGAMSPIDENGGADSDAAARAKREEEEMDEDERLLASEEGKKLSSKERRQLRNKVSARAFRSRRKEYIGQLEGDLATKASEANDLRLFNRKLLDENNQLKNLTRTLLSHPAFQTFLEDMSQNQTFVAGPAPQHMHMPAQGEMVPQQMPVKQEPDQPQESQEQTHVNMARMPESSLDMSMLNLGNKHWAPRQSGDFNNFQQPSVFAVFELPGPSLDELKRSRTSAQDVAETEVKAVEDMCRSKPETIATANDASRPAPISPVFTDEEEVECVEDDESDYSFAAINRYFEQSMASCRHVTSTTELAITSSLPTRRCRSCPTRPDYISC